MDKSVLVKELMNWSGLDNGGYFITLNGMTKDKIVFESDLGKLAHRLNDYCYGRSYKRKEKRLKLIAGIETGQLNSMLHAHLIMKFDDCTSRNFYELNAFIRKNWYETIGLNHCYGNMVDVALIGNTESRIGYAIKDINYSLRNNYLNIVLL